MNSRLSSSVQRLLLGMLWMCAASAAAQTGASKKVFMITDMEGVATDVVVWDGHDSSHTLSALDVHPRARLLTGQPVSPTLELDPSYGAVIFIGQHAMAGAEKGVLSHSYSSEGIQNIWVNNKPVGEIGGRVMLAGAFGVPVIMLSGDTAACKELRDLVPEAE